MTEIRRRRAGWCVLTWPLTVREGEGRGRGAQWERGTRERSSGTEHRPGV